MVNGCLRLSDVSVIWRVAVLDVADILGEISCTERTVQGNDFELIPTG